MQSTSSRCFLAARFLVSALGKSSNLAFADRNCKRAVATTRFNIWTRSTMCTEAKKMREDVKKIGTHDGNFHCDEVLACFMLQQLDQYKDAEIIRTRDMEVLNKCDIVVDVGAEFDVSKNRFDHHQKSFQETLSSLRPELGDKYNIRLSSAGLVYTYFGKEVIASVLKSRDVPLPPDSIDMIFQKIYENFVEEIDAIDNGVPMCENGSKYKITTHISSRIGHLNPQWNDENGKDQMKQFEKAMFYSGQEFTDIVVFYVTVWLPARNVVSEALDRASEVHESLAVIELSEPCPWKEHLFDLEKERSIRGRTMYVIFKDKPDDWRVMGVPEEPTSFLNRKFLHKDWRGLRNAELQKLSGVADARFCHMTGFIAGATKRESVIELALKSLKGDYTD